MSYFFRRSGSGGQIEITGQDTTDRVDCAHLVAEQKTKAYLTLLLSSVFSFSLPEIPDTLVTTVQ